MTRALLVGFAMLATACGGQKSFDSLCANQVPPPEACSTPCDPAPGAPSACPSGYHCAAEGKCDLLCTPSGNECGDGYSCTADGFCVRNDDQEPVVDAPDCPAVHVTATKTTPSIQLLIDRSGSMDQDFGNTKKYLAVQNALIGASGVVTRLQGQAYFGASMYPSNACPAILSIDRGLNNASAVNTFLKANPPAARNSGDNRNTPTPPSIKAVVADFMAKKPPAGSPPVIVLATDGLPNTCTDTNANTQTQSVAEAKAAYQAGIKLYVLSVGTIDGAEKHLQDMANAGLGVAPGQPNAKVFIGNNPAELAAAFEQIIGGVLSCDLQLTNHVDPADAPNGTVTMNGMRLTYGTDWTVDANGLTLRLLGNACTMLNNATNPTIDASFPCGAVIL